jgi:hypothetical protein
MFVDVGQKVTDMKKNGMSYEEVVAAAPTAPYDEVWNSWGENWKKRSLQSIYESLK